MSAKPPLLRSPLHDRHVAAGAKLVEFAGWEMPVQYGGVIGEHRAVRSAAGLFDVSHMGEFLVTGPGADRAFVFQDSIHDLFARKRIKLFEHDVAWLEERLLIYMIPALLILIIQRIQYPYPLLELTVPLNPDPPSRHHLLRCLRSLLLAAYGSIRLAQSSLLGALYLIPCW